MLRFVVVIIAVALVLLSLAVPHYAGVGLAVGIAVGVVFFFAALASGQGLVNARLRNDPGKRADPNAGISMGLGAAGIACSAVANPHYPTAFRAFYGFCGVAGCVIALVVAWRSREGEAKK